MPLLEASSWAEGILKSHCAFPRNILNVGRGDMIIFFFSFLSANDFPFHIYWALEKLNKGQQYFYFGPTSGPSYGQDVT